MKFFFDLFPVILFFAVFYLYPGQVPADQTFCLASLCIPGGKEGAIYAATLVAIVASMLQVASLGLRGQKIETMHWITLGMLIVLGGLTLFFQDERFIKWKPTLVNWALALLFLGSQWFTAKPFVQRMMEAQVRLDDDAVWRMLNYSWVAFFFLLGVVNLWVAFTFSTEFWVNFKLFGLLGLTLLFVFGQAFFLSQHIVEEESATTTEPKPEVENP